MEEEPAEIVSRETLDVLSRKDQLQSRKASCPKRKRKRKKSAEKDSTVFWKGLAVGLILLVVSIIIALLVAILARK